MAEDEFEVEEVYQYGNQTIVYDTDGGQHVILNESEEADKGSNAPSS